MFDVFEGALSAPFIPSLNEIQYSTFHLKRENWQAKAYLALTHLSFSEFRQTQVGFLHFHEQAYLNTFPAPRAKDNYLLSRYTAKLLLGKLFPQYTPCTWEIKAGVFKQPIIIGPNEQPLGISISHCQHHCAVLIFPLEHPMAVDLEFSEKHQLETINSEFTIHEKLLLAANNLHTSQGVALLWTCKEALSKIFCTGLLTPLNIYEIADLSIKNSSIESTYSNFEQYKAITWFSSSNVISLTLPKNTLLETTTVT